MVSLWLSTTILGTRPPPVARQIAWLLSGFAFMSLGAGGVQPCSMAFGADPFLRHPKEQRSGILQA